MFDEFTLVLDQIMLRAFKKIEARGNRWSLNMNVESVFTKALYRALLPANADRPMVVVLDEMNLAHPEQYFSVMLSLLENSTTDQGHLDLLTSEMKT